jgi:hypothetical protein
VPDVVNDVDRLALPLRPQPDTLPQGRVGSSVIEVIEEQFIKQLVGNGFEPLPESKNKVGVKIISD